VKRLIDECTEMLVTMINLSRRGIAVKLASNLHLGGEKRGF